MGGGQDLKRGGGKQNRGFYKIEGLETLDLH